MLCHRQSSGYRGARGYTLVELLVVLLIAGLLIATALPVAATMLDDARTREASRTLNAYFAMAKARAVATGRPCALWMELDPDSPTRQVTQCYLAESPPLYGGNSLPAARAWVEGNVLTFQDPEEMAYLSGLVSIGETILVRFDYKGDWFSFTYDGTNFNYVGSSLNTTLPPGKPANSSAPNAGRPFQVLRLPKRIGSAYELTPGTAIDLTHSGYGISDTQFANTQSRLMVVFSPTGSVTKVMRLRDPYSTEPSGTKFEMVDPPATIHFLVGRIEKTGEIGPNSNLADPTSLWVSVGAATGVVVTSENMPDPADPTNVAIAREAASSREQMGGR